MTQLPQDYSFLINLFRGYIKHLYGRLALILGLLIQRHGHYHYHKTLILRLHPLILNSPTRGNNLSAAIAKPQNGGETQQGIWRRFTRLIPGMEGLSYEERFSRLDLYSLEFRTERINHNERLEFLGDAVVEFLTSVHLYFLFPNLEEGGLATYRTAIVQNQHLAMLAK
eukprot:g42138.t1